jgi:hypothetical protein
MRARWRWSVVAALAVGVTRASAAQVATDTTTLRCDSIAARFAADSLLVPDVPVSGITVNLDPLFAHQHIGPRRGTVTLRFMIDAAGFADTASLRLSGDTLPSRKVRREVQRALQLWHWTPARAGGCPVPTRTAVLWRLPD